MTRKYPMPDTKTAWERVKKSLDIYSRAPGANIERINIFIYEEERMLIEMKFQDSQEHNYKMAFKQLNKYYTTFDNADWITYYKYYSKCAEEEQKELNRYIKQKQVSLREEETS